MVLATVVMDTAAALLNDVAKSLYPYTTQIPYLNIALNDLKEEFALHNAPVTDEVSVAITLPAGTTALGESTTPALPSGLIEPRAVWEGLSSGGSYVPLVRSQYLPLQDANTQISQFLEYIWAGGELRFLSANASIPIKIDYIRDLFAKVTAGNYTTFEIFPTAESYLHFRSAALMAAHIAENPSRAAELNNDAIRSIDRALGIAVKGQQSMITRRRPFRAGYKSRYTV